MLAGMQLLPTAGEWQDYMMFLWCATVLSYCSDNYFARDTKFSVQGGNVIPLSHATSFPWLASTKLVTSALNFTANQTNMQTEKMYAWVWITERRKRCKETPQTPAQIIKKEGFLYRNILLVTWQRLSKPKSGLTLITLMFTCVPKVCRLDNANFSFVNILGRTLYIQIHHHVWIPAPVWIKANFFVTTHKKRSSFYGFLQSIRHIYVGTTRAEKGGGTLHDSQRGWGGKRPFWRSSRPTPCKATYSSLSRTVSKWLNVTK